MLPLKGKECIAITSAFQKILYQSYRKSDKICVDHGSEFYNRSLKTWFQDNVIKMYSTHDEGQSVVAKRFIRTLKSKIHRHMTES